MKYYTTINNKNEHYNDTPKYGCLTDTMLGKEAREEHKMDKKLISNNSKQEKESHLSPEKSKRLNGSFKLIEKN